MTKRYYTFMAEPELLEALKAAAKAEPELSESAILRQALRTWLDQRGVTVKKKKPERKRAATRKRS